MNVAAKLTSNSHLCHRKQAALGRRLSATSSCRAVAAAQRTQSCCRFVSPDLSPDCQLKATEPVCQALLASCAHHSFVLLRVALAHIESCVDTQHMC